MSLILKLVGGSLLVLGLLMAASWWWMGKSLKPMTDDVRAAAWGQFVDTPGGRIYYSWTGPENGRIVVFVHGYSTPHFVFRQNIDALAAAGYRVLAFDHFGRGYSDRPAGPYDRAFYDTELTDLLDALGITGRVDLIGMSMGGLIAARYSADHPERVRNAVLLVPAGLDTASPQGLQRTLIFTPVIGDWLWRMTAKKTLMSNSQYIETHLAPENRLQGDPLKQTEYHGFLEALLSTLRHLPMSDQDDSFVALQTSGVPTLAVFGGRDDTVLPTSIDRFKLAVPGADLHVLPEGTHGLSYQNHTEVNALILAFLAESES